jgi:hypothetical protein
VRIHLYSDRRTGWPHLQFEESGQVWPQDGCVSLLPLAKAQVERFFSSGAASEFFGPRRGTALVAMEGRVAKIRSSEYEFGNGFLKIHQRSVHGKANWEESLLATNFTIQPEDWREDLSEHNQDARRAPSAGSEAAMLLTWLSGAAPNDSNDGPQARVLGLEEYKKLASLSGSVSTHKFISALLEDGNNRGLSRAAVLTLDWLNKRKQRVEKWRGLPFLSMDVGDESSRPNIWELTGTTQTVDLWAETDRSLAVRPVVWGTHSLLPSLCEENDLQRTVLLQHHPAVGLRPVLPVSVMESREPRTIDL